VKPSAEVLETLGNWLTDQHGIKLLGSLGFENAYALAMKRTRAEALQIRDIVDLAPNAPALSIAADYEFFGRPEWTALRQAYGLTFKQQRQMQPEFMYPAVASGEVDVISAFTSDGRIDQHDLQVLDDVKRAIPPYDAIILISRKRANDAAFIAALQPLVGALNVRLVRAANLRAASGSQGGADEIASWLWQQAQKERPAR
jgi:osmoprotectant transport system permease protein